MLLSHSPPQSTSFTNPQTKTAFSSPPAQLSSTPSPDFFLSSSSLASTCGMYQGSISTPPSGPPTTSKTFIHGRCHCGLNTFVAVFPKPKKPSDPNIASNYSYPSSSASVSSQLNLPASNHSSTSVSGSTTSESEPSLPIPNDLCHCNSCRHSSGQLAVYHVSMLGPPLASATISNPHSRDSSGSLSSDADKRRIAPPSARARVKTHSPYLGLGVDMGRIQHGLCGEGNDASGLISALKAVTEDDGLDQAAADQGSEDGDPDAENEWERPFDFSGLAEYRTSPDAIRLFCKSCSAHLFLVYTISPDETLANSTIKSRQSWKWCVAGGALERTAGVVKLNHHIWVGDTFDGGIADHLQVVDGVTMARFRGDVKSDQVVLGWRKALLNEPRSFSSSLARRPRPHPSGASERLPLYCHCGSIRLLVTRPTFESTMPSAPFPDVICPSDSRLSKRRNIRDLKWWLRPPLGHPVPSNTDPEKNATHATRYLAAHCMCDTCRLTSGMEVQSWLWIPNCNVLDARTGNPIVLDHAVPPPSTDATPSHSVPELQRRPRAGLSSPPKSILSDGSSSPTFTASPSSSGRSSPVQKEPTTEKEDIEELYLPSGRLEALTQYTPSPGRYRESCSKCGATVLLWSTQVPDILCVAAGLIDENYGHGGARAEAWFDWYTERVGFVEEALQDTGLGHRGSTFGLNHAKGDSPGYISSLKATAEGLIAGLAQLKKESEDELKEKTMG